jgi:hypothetical protein
MHLGTVEFFKCKDPCRSRKANEGGARNVGRATAVVDARRPISAPALSRIVVTPKASTLARSYACRCALSVRANLLVLVGGAGAAWTGRATCA